MKKFLLISALAAMATAGAAKANPVDLNAYVDARAVSKRIESRGIPNRVCL